MKYLFLFISLILFSRYTLEAQSLIVPSPAYPLIQSAIDAAQPGDTIIVSQGVYTENLRIMTSDLVLIGDQRLTRIVDSNSQARSPIIFCDSVRNVQITGFSLSRGSKGIELRKSDSIRIFDNTLTDNFSTLAGSGIFLDDNSSAIITENLIQRSGEGIGIRQGSYARILGNSINNCRGAFGGGIQAFGSEIDVRDNSISQCWDGAINMNMSTGVIIRNFLSGNESWTNAGGMNLINSNVSIYNTLIKNSKVNNSVTQAAGININQGNVDISNCMFINNRGAGSSTSRGTAISFKNHGACSVKNTIFYANTNGSEVVYSDGSGTIDFAYNDFFVNTTISQTSGLIWGPGNITADPLFCNTTEYFLDKSSPCIDTGDPSPNSNDLNGSRNDMGFKGGPNGSYNPISVQLSNSIVNFGVVSTCDTLIKTEFLINRDACRLYVDSIRIQKGNYFFINHNYTNLCLDEGDSVLVEIQYIPLAQQPSTDTLWIYTRDSSISVVLQGQSTSCLSKPYYHPFQNYNDDVDRVKRFSNNFGGNPGTTKPGNSPHQFTQHISSITRKGDGKSMRLDYQGINSWEMYIESFIQNWTDSTIGLNFEDLFPDYTIPGFINRKVDSIAFYGLLVSTDTLSIKLELHDQLDRASSVVINVPPDSQWRKFSVGLNQFVDVNPQTPFNPRNAKFLGFVISKRANPQDPSTDNLSESGSLFIDDIFLVEKNYTKPTFSQDSNFLQYLNAVSFRHFWTAIDEDSKFALDRHIWKDLISVDAIGFQLSTYVIAHRNGWIDPQKIEARVEHILNYLVNVCQHTNDTTLAKNNPTAYASVNGIWAHFLDNNTLSRKNERTEYSLFTNALLLSGVMVAQQYFTNNNNINQWSDSLIRRTNWNFLYRPQDSLMYFHWAPEEGHSIYYTDFFSEELDLAFLLASTHPEPAKRLPVNPYFSHGYGKCCCHDIPNMDYVFSAPGANFTYYFLQMYARFDTSTQRFENAQHALMKDLLYSQQNFGPYGLDSRVYGITACEGPDSAGFKIDILTGDTIYISNYHAYGYDCKLDKHNTPNGTFAIYGSASTILFMPQEAIAALKYFYEELDSSFHQQYDSRFFSPIFGMPDAFNLDPDASTDTLINGLNFNGPWLSVPRFGIDIGPMLMNIDSYLEELNGRQSIRNLFNSHPYITGELTPFETLDCHLDSQACICFTSDLPETLISSSGPSTICQGDTLTLTAPEGYTYLWSTGAITRSIRVHNSGSYSVKVTDEDCIKSDTLLIRVSNPNVSIDVQKNPHCFGSQDGSISVNTQGGITPYTFIWNSGSTDSMLTSLSSGVYKVIVTDQAGCQDSLLSTLIDPQELQFTTSIEDVSCSGISDGQISISASGGSGTLSYSLDGGVFQANPIFNGLDSGTYVITVKDADGCTESVSIAINSPTSISSQTKITSNYSQANISCFGATDGSAKISVNGGIAPYTFQWNTNPIVNDSVANNLGVGTYAITVTDQNGCIHRDSVRLNDPDKLLVDLTSDSISCQGSSDGSINTVVSGGTGPYEYNWDNGSTEPNPMNLKAGTYVLILTDNNGCQIRDSIVVEDAESARIDLGGPISIFCNQGDLTTNGNWISYLWNTGETTQTINVSSNGWYKVIATNNQGCIATDSTQVLVLDSVQANFTFDTLALTVSFNPLRTQFATEYLWLFGDGDSSTQQNPTHTFASCDIYYVTLQASNVCGTDIVVDTVNLICPSIKPILPISYISLSPNPSNGIVNLYMEGLKTDGFQLSVLDLRGRVISQENTRTLGSYHTQKIDMSPYVSGVYIVQVKFANGSFIHRKVLLERR